MNKQLTAARNKPENKLGAGGFAIALKDPKEFVNKMRTVTFDNPEGQETQIQAKSFNSLDKTDQSNAAVQMGEILQGEQGATIIDD